MASELPSAALSATAPRIDRQFVIPGTGLLTQSGYELLFRLLTRTGGVGGVDSMALLDAATFSALAPTGPFAMADGFDESPAGLGAFDAGLGIDPRAAINQSLIDLLQSTTLGISQRFEF